MGMDISSMTNTGNSGFPSMMGTSAFKVWQEMLPGENGKPVSELLEKQYDLIYGSWPNSYNEIVLVVDET